jgi:hypothetical protein
MAEAGVKEVKRVGFDERAEGGLATAAEVVEQVTFEVDGVGRFGVEPGGKLGRFFRAALDGDGGLARGGDHYVDR